MRDAAVIQPSSEALVGTDPRSVTRGSFCGTGLNNEVYEAENGDRPAPKQPPGEASKKPRRRSRKKQTSSALQAVFDAMFFDWFGITLPHPETGKGSGCERNSEVETIAVTRLVEFAEKMALHRSRVRNGINGYGAGADYTMGSEERDTVLTILSGHQSNMPGMAIPGGHGACQDLAEAVVDHFGSDFLVNRADVTLDHSQEGLFDALLEMSQEFAGQRQKMRAPTIIQSDTGRTFYLGSDRVKLKVYQKDLERVANGRIDASDADPHLVRIEFSIAPQSREKKAFAGLNPGEMLRTSVWGRAWMAAAAQIMGMTREVDPVEPMRIEREERSRTLDDSVDHGIRQYGASFVRLAVSNLVPDDDYAGAKLSEKEVEEELVRLLREKIAEAGTITRVLTEEGLDRVMGEDERSAMIAADVLSHSDRRERERIMTRSRLDQLTARRSASIAASAA